MHSQRDLIFLFVRNKLLNTFTNISHIYTYVYTSLH